MDTIRYTIGELATAAGTTPRTIRYYTAEGLLPPPDTRGKYALYGQDHLLRLRLIARLKDAYLPLGEIKARLDALDERQLAALLDELPAAPQRIAESATDYITQLLDAQQHTVRAQRSAPAAPAASAILPAAPAPMPPAAAPVVRAQRVTPLPSAAAPMPPAAATAEETWQRTTLAPGVELHTREPLDPSLRDRIGALIAQARQLLHE